eukprot:scaffold93796_cov31-Tisochrysis_lutea.AAC.4
MAQCVFRAHAYTPSAYAYATRATRSEPSAQHAYIHYANLGLQPGIEKEGLFRSTGHGERADVFIGSLKAAILHAKAVADVAASTYNTSS